MGKVFLIGASGHIGGDLILQLLEQWPDLEITGLVRNEEKAAKLRAAYPTLKTVIGDMEDLELVEKYSKENGVVINVGPDNAHAATTAAISRGLSTLHPRKGYYIHMAGAAVIWNEPDGSKSTGKIWDDLVDIDEIISRPDTCVHSVDDKAVRSHADKMNVCIVSPVLVYGHSRSPTHPTPLTMQDVVATMRDSKGGFTIRDGANIWAYVHCADVASLIVPLVADALKGVAGGESRAELWGPQAYYFAADEELSFREYMALLAPLIKAKGVIPTDEIKPLDMSAAKEAARGDDERSVWSDQITMMFGCDMRCRSSRAKKLLGWQPKGPRVKETLPEVVDAFFQRGNKH